MKTTVRIKRNGKPFEILVDLDSALDLKKGKINSIEIEGDRIFKNAKKGEVSDQASLIEAFKTSNPEEIAIIIIKKGEILTNQEYRDEKKDQKLKQVIELISTNAIDPKTGNPLTNERIKSVLKEARINIKDGPVEDQLKDIVSKISAILPIKIKSQKIKVNIPVMYTGQAYGLIKRYIEKENWLSDGTLETLLEIPSGILLDFYDKLNSVTHGSAMTEEILEE